MANRHNNEGNHKGMEDVGCTISMSSDTPVVSSDEDSIHVSPYQLLLSSSPSGSRIQRPLATTVKVDQTLLPTPSAGSPVSATTVVFDPVVSIFPIPPRSEYSHPHEVWSSFEEIEAMKARNWLEFAADGFDWRNVAEESDMQVDGDEHAPSCDAAGERATVHPIHNNPMLGSALLRRIPYPKARHFLDHAADHDCSGGAVFEVFDHGSCLERPDSPFVGPHGDQYEDPYYDDEYD